ncbi:hypothetical protein M413DRAFT_246914 [Hebeloma cylindrosporum]|uniref:F-box domain-containing protein n=1 Tax=Hebeloma cylindrosporum TaxID=76867 RepID=A0A0C3BND1_HEBCY|nr:hypothetical protein M413DRAFT_246914 [Hebeloma cylindrosporum h7]
MILSLPPEIQGEIFARAHRDNSDDKALLLPVEVTLSHVCSEWRNNAINLPTLWTAFKFDTRRQMSPPVDKLEKYLHRSKTLLLELYFDISSTDCEEWDEYNELFFQLFKVAVAHIGRWRRFTLFRFATDPDESPVDIGTFNFMLGECLFAPNLEYLAMCLASLDLGEGVRQDDGGIRPSVLIRGAPKLSAIRIDTTSHHYSLPPLSNLTTLTIQESPDLYSFPTLRSFLTIPTLTNLSIETSSGLHSNTLHPETIPLIVMPSLRVLRITQDYSVASILSLLDAPLLETVVLYDLNLTTMHFGQDVHSITSFQNLDTIALLNCRYEGSPDVDGGFNPVDRILNALAYCATHIVISSLYDTSCYLEPYNSDFRTDLLDFDKYRWHRLRRVTLDVSSFDDLMFHVKNLEQSPRWITFRVVEPLLERWRKEQCDSLTRLGRFCKVESIQVGDLMMDEYWPAPGGMFHEDGNLHVCWGESIRARGAVEVEP